MANVALVRLDILVNLLVDPERRGMGEAFAAEPAFTVPDAPVDILVLLELVRVGKRFRTLVAVEFSEFPVDDFDMVFKDSGRGELPVALLALV